MKMKVVIVTVLIIIIATLSVAIFPRARNACRRHIGYTARVQTLSQALQNRQQNEFLQALREYENIMLGKETYHNEREKERVVGLILLSIEDWILNDFDNWHSVDDERRLIFALIMSSQSAGPFMGLGAADSDEGFELVRKAIVKYNKEHSMPGRSLNITRHEDGQVGIGIITRYP